MVGSFMYGHLEFSASAELEISANKSTSTKKCILTGHLEFCAGAELEISLNECMTSGNLFL